MVLEPFEEGLRDGQITFNCKYRGKTREHLLEAMISPNYRCLSLTKFITRWKTTLVVISGHKSSGWEIVRETIVSLISFPYPTMDSRGIQI